MIDQLIARLPRRLQPLAYLVWLAAALAILPGVAYVVGVVGAGLSREP